MEPTPLSGEARVTSWRVFALVLFSAAYFFQSSGHNEAARFDQIRSLMEHGEWWIDRFAGNTADVIRVGSHTYPGKAPGTTLAGALPWGLARVLFSALPLDEGKQLILATYALTVLMSALPTAFTSLLILRFLARNGWTITRAAALSLGYGLGTIAFPFATVFFGHQLAASFAFGAFYLIWTGQWITGGPGTLRLLLSGLLIGFLPVIEHPGALASGLIGFYAVATMGWRGSWPVILGAVVGVLPLPLYNAVAFGSPGALVYGFYAREGSAFPAHQAGFMGVSWPRFETLREITFKAPRGLFHANPWLAFSLMAPFFVRRIRGLGREFALSAAILGGFLIFNSGYGNSIVYWGGGYSFGPRHLLVALPFAVLLAAFPMKSRLFAPLIGLLILATTLLMLPATSIDPRLPYEPSEPFFGFYLPLYARGLVSVYPWSTFGGSTLFGSPGAFNLGRAAGLPRDLEVLPLAFVWALAALSLARTRARGERLARASVATLIIAVGLWPALPRLSPWSVRETGLCQAISPNRTWPYFSDYALPDEPSPAPGRRRVAEPSIALTDQMDASASGELSKVAVTFSGNFEPGAPGWYVFRVDTIGQAALYIDGLQRLKLEGPEQFQRTRTARVFLAQAPHELIVRFMSDQKDRQLSVSVALGEGPSAPFNHGLTSGECR